MTTGDSPYHQLSKEELIALLEGQTKESARKHRSTYTQRNALQFRDVFESVIKTGQPALLRYADYPQISERTLYNKVTDGLYWLVCNTEGDARKKWEVFKQTVKIKPLGEGIVIGMAEAIRKPRGIEPITAVSVAASDWREDLTMWLENAPSGAIFNRDGLRLTADEVTSLQQQISEIGLACHINTQTIRVMK